MHLSYLKYSIFKKKYSIFIFISIFSLVLIKGISSSKSLDENMELKFLEIKNEKEKEKEKEIKFSNSKQNNKNNNLPIAVFHGIGDACDGFMLNWTNYFAEKSSVYSRCIESGANIKSELNSIFNQGEAACEIIKSDPNFQNDFIIVGFSQGGLIGRYILEKCDMKGTVRKLITLGTPHMGIYRIPKCPESIKFICNLGEYLGQYIIFTPGAYRIYSPLAYFRTPSTEGLYRRFNYFLADLNNENYNNSNKEANKSKFLKLNKLVLINFSDDDMVYPKESAWFRKYNSDWEVEPLEKSTFYTEDYLGLRKLNEENKIEFHTFEGVHMKLTKKNIDAYVIPAILN